MPRDGGEAVQINSQGAFEMFAAPDGKTLIYSKGFGKFGLWTVGVNGGDERPVPELAEAGVWRSWTISAGEIHYTDFASAAPFPVKFFDFKTRRAKIIGKVETAPLAYYSSLSIAPDGRTILYARHDQSASSIMLAEFF